MSVGINKVILIGHLGQDPEVRRTGSGGAVCSLRLATTERRKDASGQWSDHTEWHSVVTFGTVAENVGRFLKKGRQVFIEGRLQTRKWQDKEGKDRYSTEVIANTVQFLGGRQEGAESGSNDSYESAGSGFGGGAGNGSSYGNAPQGNAGGGALSALGLKAADEVAFDDDDIPF